MSAASAILCLTRFSFLHRSLDPKSSFWTRSFKPISGFGSAFGKSCSRGPRTMIKTTVAFGDGGDGDGGVRALEQEALVKHSAEVNGLEATVNRLSKWVVSGLFGAAIVWRHDGAAMWAVTGSVVNSLLSFVLKRVLNQERPVPGLRSDPGMPSSHAQTIFFMVTLALMSNLQWLGINSFSLSLSFLAFALGSYLSWLRIRQKLHTFSQVLVGAVLGSAFSIFWFLSWDAFISEAFHSSPLVQLIVILGGVAFSALFAIYVLKYWFLEEVR